MNFHNIHTIPFTPPLSSLQYPPSTRETSQKTPHPHSTSPTPHATSQTPDSASTHPPPRPRKTHPQTQTASRSAGTASSTSTGPGTGRSACGFARGGRVGWATRRSRARWGARCWTGRGCGKVSGEVRFGGRGRACTWGAARRGLWRVRILWV
jgi:hypothetical protein